MYNPSSFDRTLERFGLPAAAQEIVIKAHLALRDNHSGNHIQGLRMVERCRGVVAPMDLAKILAQASNHELYAVDAEVLRVPRKLFFDVDSGWPNGSFVHLHRRLATGARVMLLVENLQMNPTLAGMLLELVMTNVITHSARDRRWIVDGMQSRLVLLTHDNETGPEMPGLNARLAHVDLVVSDRAFA